MQTTDKFKAGATTLEVIHNAQKYIPNKYYNTLSNLQLEDLITYADDAGDFRFDIKWSALDPETNNPISVFIDTKNYSSASNMFKNLGQFKAYLGAIDNFDNLYIIQQGGRGVTREQIINRLKSVLNDGNNKDEVFEVIWNTSIPQHYSLWGTFIYWSDILGFIHWYGDFLGFLVLA